MKFNKLVSVPLTGCLVYIVSACLVLMYWQVLLLLLPSGLFLSVVVIYGKSISHGMFVWYVESFDDWRKVRKT